jgi:ribonuclease T1
MKAAPLRTLLLVLAAALAFVPPALARERSDKGQALQEEIRVTQLPREAHETLALIRQGGPFPYRQDGSMFGNREGRLPRQERGYYREYTVGTPGARDRGPRRIVAGGEARTPSHIYYTDNHYRSFKRVRD